MGSINHLSLFNNQFLGSAVVVENLRDFEKSSRGPAHFPSPFPHPARSDGIVPKDICTGRQCAAAGRRRLEFVEFMDVFTTADNCR